MDVIELRNPKALLIPEVQALLKRAVEAGTFLAPGGFDTVAEDVFNMVTDEYQFMLLGAEKGAFKSVVLGHLPVGNLFPYPTIVLFYNEGSRALSRATGVKLMDFIVSHGYTKTLAVNSSGHADDVWMKGIVPSKATAHIAGSLAVIEVE